jgi:hypothetical protein
VTLEIGCSVSALNLVATPEKMGLVFVGAISECDELPVWVLE